MTLDFSALFQALPGLYAVVRADAPRFTIVAASDAYLASIHCARERFVDRAFFEYFNVASDEQSRKATVNVRASFDRVIATRAADALPVQRYDIARPAGEGGGLEARYWSPINAPLLDANGAVTHVIHAVVDITEFMTLKTRGAEEARHTEVLRTRVDEMEAEVFLRSRQIEEANQKLHLANAKLVETREAEFRALFDFMPQLGWTAQPDGFLDFYNRGWYEYTGTTYEQMQGWGWQRVHDPEILPQVIAGWTDALARKEPWEMEFPLRRHDGVFRWFLTRVNPIRNAAGEIVRWVGINTDIHDRKQAGARTEARLRLLMESIQDYAIFMLDTDGNVATWSPGAERITGYTAEEVIGKPVSIFYAKEESPSDKSKRELAIATSEGRFEEEGWRVKKDGSRYWANVVITAVRNEELQIIGFAKVTRDLTERRAADEERARLLQAEQAIQLRDEFLAIASHELKTPLTALQLQLQSIAMRIDGLDGKLASRFHRATSSADRLGALVEMLLDVARITSGRLTLERQRLDLVRVVHEVADRFGEQSRQARSPISVSAEGAIFGEWDRLRLEQVLTNLLANALKYAAGHPVEIAASADPGHALVTVTDHGAGISAADLPRLFRRFERASSIKHYGGLGLGLFISREIVEAHGGSIEVKSSPGKGATFTIRLPIVPIP